MAKSVKRSGLGMPKVIKTKLPARPPVAEAAVDPTSLTPAKFPMVVESTVDVIEKKLIEKKLAESEMARGNLSRELAAEQQNCLKLRGEKARLVADAETLKEEQAEQIASFHSALDTWSHQYEEQQSRADRYAFWLRFTIGAWALSLAVAALALASAWK